MRRVYAGMIVCLLAGVRPAQAQGTDAPRLFVDGTALAAVNLRSHSEYRALIETSNDLSLTVPGEAVTVGTFLHPKVSLRLEAAFPWGGKTRPEGGVLPLDPGGFRIAQEIRLRNRSVAVMLGYHTQRHGRVRLGYLGGAAFVHEELRSTISRTSPGLPPFIPPVNESNETRSINYRLALALGADLEVPLATHFSLIPQVRVVAFPGEVSLRPGLGLRWTP